MCSKDSFHGDIQPGYSEYPTTQWKMC